MITGREMGEIFTGELVSEKTHDGTTSIHLKDGTILNAPVPYNVEFRETYFTAETSTTTEIYPVEEIKKIIFRKRDEE